MIDREQFERLQKQLPVLRELSAEMAREFMANAYQTRLQASADVFVEGDEAAAIALLLSGRVRVYKIGETGRELTLYRFGGGESCVLTANAILSHETFPALATVEETADVVMIPAAAFRDWVDRYKPWRAFVFDLLSLRLARVLTVVEEITFKRLDARLADYLLARSAAENPLHTTHQIIADDLGSSREVISRLLADFAAEKLVKISRGTIDVLDRAGLARRALM
ncbi:MAG: Crp/Fnr family transcriptional regulator [Candidatus Promineifilaceae bacterium]